jgi:hypothetical protein
VDDRILTLDERSAREIVLARAIDDVDAQGKLVGAAEREQIEREALEASQQAASGLDFAAYLQGRARRLLALVELRQPRIAALQDPEGWRGMLLVLLPLAACILGAALDRIDNPHQVNMLSPPLLGVLAWNVAVYILLLVEPLLPHPPRVPFDGLRRWLRGLPGQGRRTGRLRTDVLARFHEHWLRATSAQQWSWFKQLLHLSAAGWAAGLAISIVLGGVVREYRVGWESTLLGVDQVHALLRALFAPVVALLPFEGFSVADLQRMSFHANVAVPVEEARRWVWMYVALLFVLVIVPRLLLATWAAWRRARHARTVRIDLREPYFVQLLARISPAQVTLGLVAREGAAREAILRMLLQVADRPAPAGGGKWNVLGTAKGDVLRLFEVPPRFRPPAAVVPEAATAMPAGQAWLQELVGRFKGGMRPQEQRDAVQLALNDTDLLLLAAASPAEVQDATRLLQWVGQPVLVLVPEDAPAWRDAVQRLGPGAQLLPLAHCAAHWMRDGVLLEAAAARLPEAKRAGFERLAATWKDRNAVRFAEAMRLVAAELVRAARDSEEAGSAPVSLRTLVSAAERDASQRAREDARAALLQRMRAGEAALLAGLVQLHGTGAPVAPVAGARLEQGFAEQDAVDSPQAGLAGAATGAAMGAGIDLLTGGLTLGAATALGALIGGGAAYTAAVWKNRGTPSGQPQVQLGDELLQTLAENLVLAYLAVAHRVLPREEASAAWRADVVAAVEARREQLAAAWNDARAAAQAGSAVAPLARALEDVVRGLLERLD